MFKNSQMFPFITNEYENFLSGVSDILLEMSSDRTDLNAEDLEDILRDIDDIITTPHNSQNQTDEDLQNIRELEDLLISTTPMSPQITSNESIGPTEELLDIIEEPQIVMDVIQPNMETMRVISDSLQSTSNLSPLSPVTDVCQTINSLTINNPLLSPSYTSLPNFEETTHPSPLMGSQRMRCLSDGSQYSDGIFHFNPFLDNSINRNPQQMDIRPTRVAHSAQPYRGSYTDPLPEFGTTFGQNVCVQRETNLQTIGCTLGSNPLSPELSRPEETFPDIVRWRSEPALRLPDYNRSHTSHRGRPFIRHHSRRQPTARERREQLESELTAQEITHYELHKRVRYLFSVTQQARRQVQIERGWTKNQLDAYLAQMNSHQNPREGQS